jgi:CheY-like chemotaxis protein
VLPAGVDDVVARGNAETILVVEDDDQARQTFCDALEALNYRVLCAPNGREALDTYEQNCDEIALVLCDVVMPEMGGFALLQALRQRYSSVKVVMLTGSWMDEERLWAEGLAGWLRKPCSLAQLAGAMAQALGPSKVLAGSA